MVFDLNGILLCRYSKIIACPFQTKLLVILKQNIDELINLQANQGTERNAN